MNSMTAFFFFKKKVVYCNKLFLPSLTYYSGIKGVYLEGNKFFCADPKKHVFLFHTATKKKSQNI